MNKDKTLELLNRFPHFYDKTSGSNNYKILNVYIGELEEISKQIEAYYKSINIEEAEGTHLDRLGNIQGVKREFNEKDGEYRRRILSASTISTYETTFKAIKEAIFSIVDARHLFHFVEGIDSEAPDPSAKPLSSPNNVFNGKFSKGATKKIFYKKGGCLYICINKRITEQKKTALQHVLAETIAAGIKLILDFKYEHGGNYYDEVVISKWKEPGIAEIGQKEIEKQGVN